MQTLVMHLIKCGNMEKDIYLYMNQEYSSWLLINAVALESLKTESF